ncbi:sigma 54-interacting transcriptional regulator [Azohydromonas lata]|uniref:Sigma 54-interacting transcriptional regulator n=1 Tax=Azohydromonas lata TaxID=45677 RepID=A0ABU5IMG3_9BURK|nr:sigma 54-interacting transcriptional regulator [Azohydromonas lata]MDZ5460101.1 sigma 54-interacting transcriptional regulator [Azohydromonas lata]
MRKRKATTAAAASSEQESMLAGQLRFAPETGHILLFDQRMLLMHGFSLAELRKEVIQRLGVDTARGMFTRLGYQQGLEDWSRVKEAFGTDVATAIALGTRLRDMEGYVRNTPLEVHFSHEDGEFYGDFTWSHSWEAEVHLKSFGISGMPACWMNVGYATAFATSLFGQPLLAREIECVCMGHGRCRAVLRPVSQWSDVDEDLRFFQAESFVDSPVGRGSPRRSEGLPAQPQSTSPLQQELVGASAAFNSVVYLLKRVAQTDSTVLFLGESGVGKERFSRTLHEIGPRSKGPFVSVNCAAIPGDLVEAELFGVEKGAFTGATASRPGRFERANGGTLFLDEIGSLPLAAQGKLLRALQEREIERVGGTATRKVNVRVVAATNENLRQAMADGRFRADLFFRLNVFPIRIPPLRERREDIVLMLHVFIERFSGRIGKSIKGVTRKALDALWNYAWPGNVRELENMVERAVILADDDGTLDVHHLFSGGEVVDVGTFSLSPAGQLVRTGTASDSGDTTDGLAQQWLERGHTLEQAEAALLTAAMQRSGGNLSAAAKSLGIGRGQMQYRMSKLRRPEEQNS